MKRGEGGPRWGHAARGLALLGFFTLSANGASAAPCGRPDVDATFPPNDAKGVPQNAFLAAHYRAPADFQGEAVTLTGPDGDELGVDASYDTAESMLRAIPRTALRAGVHRIVWPALRGVASSIGLGQTTTFTVGAATDMAGPRFSGTEGVEWRLSREHDPCTSGLEDRFEYDLELGEITDDLPTELLSVVVFETKSPTHGDGVPKELAVLPLVDDGHVHVERSSTRAGTVCFAAVVRDLVLNVSGGGDQEVCTKTTAPPYFEGCSLSPRRSGPAGAWVALAVLGLVLLRRNAKRSRLLGAVGAVGLLALSGCDERGGSRGATPRPPVREASAFDCDGELCRQRHVRLPDDGEWRCADMDGVALCAGGEPAAGIVRASAERGFRCGERRGKKRERVCVDLAPDFPPGGEAAYRCRFDAEHGVTRECRPRVTEIGMAQATLPETPPNCWLDADCGGRCDRGYCAGGFAMRQVLSALSWLCLGVGCSRTESGECWLWLSADPADGVRLEDARITPEGVVLERRTEGRRVALRLRALGEAFVVRAPGACPVEVATGEGKPGSVLERRLESLFDLGPATRVAGPDREFELRPKPRCAAAREASVELRVSGGAPLERAASVEGGRAFSGKTRGIDELSARPLFGIVPVSAARRGMTEITALVRFENDSVEQKLEVSALTRASGLPNVAVEHAVLVAGKALRLAARPEDSQAALRPVGDLWELVPDQSGVYAVADEQGRKLDIDAGRYDETPLDCGRGDCHQALTTGMSGNPMLRALAEDLGGRHPLANPECALACHATGEPGTSDGGFSHVRAELGDMAGLPETFGELPRALRRLGGVGCLACHGPGTIPEASARWAVLQSSVCAVCHDAPPRYGHVAALALSRMSEADRNPRTQSDERCARCHTTWGARGEPKRKPPTEAQPSGIGCATCHEVHPSHDGMKPSARMPSLLRDTPLPPVLRASDPGVLGPSRICLGCHAPDADAPTASATALWAGRGGLDVSSNDELYLPSAHVGGDRGCLTCHDAGPDSLALGRGHAFQAPMTACTRCHTDGRGRSPAIAQRAKSLFQALAPQSARWAPGEPPHAARIATDRSTARGRALHDVLLVLEDPAADVHNPRYANALLDHAEAVVKNPDRSRPPAAGPPP